MAPHNLTEVIEGIKQYIDNEEVTIDELMKFIKAPDFPTGGIIYGYQGVKSAFETGRGRIVMRARAEIIENDKGKNQIIVSEIPYQVNKASMIEKTAALINDKKIEGITDIRDESDRKGLRVVYDLRKDAVPNVVLNNLYKYTQLQSSFGVNNVALVKGRPQTLNLKQIIAQYVEHRHNVVIRRTQYELDEAERRLHLLEGYLIALDNLDEVINIIRSSQDPETARNTLMSSFELTELQARAILDMRLQRLTGLERDKIQKEYEEVKEQVAYLRKVLEDKSLRMQIIKDELDELLDRFGDERRTEIVHSAEDISTEDIIPNEEMLLTISHSGYIKRTPLAEYRTQGRGGVGARGVSVKDGDFTEHMFIAHTHNYLMIFTEQGKVFWIKVYEIPEGSKTSKGRAIQNLINISADDTVRTVINVKSLEDADYVNNHFLVMCTKKGSIKKTSLEAYSRPRANGINAITIHEGDMLLNVCLTDGKSDIIMGVRSGRAIRFNEEEVRPMGRTAAGVRGIALDDEKDEVIGMVCISDMNQHLLVVSEKGFGKRSQLNEYRITRRGGKGIKTMNITSQVTDADDLMIINSSGIMIRLSVSELRVMGRATQGVRLIRLSEDNYITSVAKVDKLPEAVVEEGNGTGTNTDSDEQA
jgi:DNA gyrase subunit A